MWTFEAYFTITLSAMKNLLKLEEAAELLVAVVIFSQLPFAWWWLPALFLVPDLSMLAYLAGPVAGAATYNLLHHKALAFGVLLLGWWLAQPVLLLAGSVLLFHTAFDRLMGYGLKYSTHFKHTHLGAIRAEAASA